MMSSVSPRDRASAFAVRFLGVLLHARQAEFLDCRTPVKVAACGRRWGKTTAAACDALWFAVTRPGSTQFIVAPTSDQSRILFAAARELAEGGELAGAIGRVVDSPFPELSLNMRDAEGNVMQSVIRARSAAYDGKHLRGHGADRVLVDEAAFVPAPVLREVVPPMLAASPRAELVLLSTPFGSEGAFYAYFQRGLLGDPHVRSFHYPTSSNPGVSAEYLKRQREEMTELAYRVEYGAEFLDDDAAVFSRAVITACLDEVIDTRPLPGHAYVCGFDPAKYSDRSGVVVVDVTTRPYKTVHVEDIGGRDYLIQAGRIVELTRTYNGARLLLDVTSHAQMLEELKRRGVRAEGYTFTNASKNDLIDNLVLAMERGDLRIPRDAHDLIRELTYYHFERTAAGNVRLGAPDRGGIFDDLVTALALAAWSARRPRLAVPRYAVGAPRWVAPFDPGLRPAYRNVFHPAPPTGRLDEELPVEELRRRAALENKATKSDEQGGNGF